MNKVKVIKKIPKLMKSLPGLQKAEGMKDALKKVSDVLGELHVQTQERYLKRGGQ